MADQRQGGITWTDETWNPTTGCDRVSPGCDHCYALTMAKRLKAMGQADYQLDGDPATSGPGFGFQMHPHRLDQPLRWTRPRRIFVNSMSDLFHAKADREFLAQVFAVMAASPRHTFQVLTKRPQIARSILSAPLFWHEVAAAYYDLDVRGGIPEQMPDWPLSNVWLGTSVEDQKRADLRIPALLETPAAVRFLSCEPLLGPIDLRRYIDPERDCNCGVPTMDGAGQHAVGCRCFTQPDIGWVIVGGESGRHARPMHPDWARRLRDQCAAAGVPFHFKQWGEWTPNPTSEAAPDGAVTLDGRLVRAGDETWIADTFTAAPVARVGKHKAGRVLDGRTWNEYPTAVTA